MTKKTEEQRPEKKPTLRLFKNKSFRRFARSEDITDDKLIDAVKDIEKGLIDADLGGSVVKQRVAREGQGKSGGHRIVILYRKGTRAFFVHGYSKNDQDNLTSLEIETFKEMAKHVLALSDEDLEKAIADNVFTEVVIDEQDKKKTKK